MKIIIIFCYIYKIYSIFDKRFFKPTGQNVDLYLLAMFKEITMCQDLLENQFPKCENVVDSVKKSFKDNSKLEVLN